jgi:hypothetical protein
MTMRSSHSISESILSSTVGEEMGEEIRLCVLLIERTPTSAFFALHLNVKMPYTNGGPHVPNERK